MKRIPITQVVLGLLCLMYLITYVDRVNVSTASEGFGREFGLNKTQIGFVFSAFAYPYLVFQIIGGWFSDRLGTRRTLITFGTIWAVATVLTGLATGLVARVFVRGIFLRRDDHRPHVGHPDGYRAGLVGDRQRHDEHRLGHRRHHFTSGVRLFDRPLPGLGAAVRV